MLYDAGPPGGLPSLSMASERTAQLRRASEWPPFSSMASSGLLNYARPPSGVQPHWCGLHQQVQPSGLPQCWSRGFLFQVWSPSGWLNYAGPPSGLLCQVQPQIGLLNYAGPPSGLLSLVRPPSEQHSYTRPQRALPQQVQPSGPFDSGRVASSFKFGLQVDSSTPGLQVVSKSGPIFGPRLVSEWTPTPAQESGQGMNSQFGSKFGLGMASFDAGSDLNQLSPSRVKWASSTDVVKWPPLNSSGPCLDLNLFYAGLVCDWSLPTGG